MTSQNTHYIFVATGTAGYVYPFIGLAKIFQGRGRKVALIGWRFIAIFSANLGCRL